MKTEEGKKRTKCYFQGINRGKRETIDKAIEWLALNMHKYVVSTTYNGTQITGLHIKYISDFKEAMKK